MEITKELKLTYKVLHLKTRYKLSHFLSCAFVSYRGKNYYTKHTNKHTKQGFNYIYLLSGIPLKSTRARNLTILIYYALDLLKGLNFGALTTTH